MPPPAKAAPVKATPPKAPVPDDDSNGSDVPVSAEETDLRAQMARMQARLDTLEAQKPAGTDDDPVGTGLRNLAMHVQAKCDASSVLAGQPDTDEVRQLIVELREKDSDAVSSDDTSLLRDTIDEWRDANPHTDLHYIRQLAREVHKAVVKRERGE